LKRLVSVIFLISYAFSEDFISEFEYGQMLYQNPRGVSCSKCHGKLGEGEFIASFKDSNGEIREFYGPDIRDLDIKTFKKALKSGGNLMPRYYLTQKELEAIYKYIKEVNKLEKSKETKEPKSYDEITEFENNDTLEEVDINSTFDDASIEEVEDGSEDENGIISKVFKTTEDEEGE